MRMFFCWMAIACLCSTSRAQPPLTLHYYERPPYMMSNDDGSARGLTASPAQAALTQAGVAFHWENTPASRQLLLIERNTGPDCGVGWYKNPQRERIGQFSAPLHQDAATVALARPNFQVRNNSLAATVADPQVRVLMKGGLTYGKDVLAIMAKARAEVQKVSGEHPQLVRMVAADRADFLLLTPEEARVLSTPQESGPQALKIITFSDVRGGETRHLLCSKQVRPSTLARINQALQRLPPP